MRYRTNAQSSWDQNCYPHLKESSLTLSFLPNQTKASFPVVPKTPHSHLAIVGSKNGYDLHSLSGQIPLQQTSVCICSGSDPRWWTWHMSERTNLSRERGERAARCEVVTPNLTHRGGKKLRGKLLCCERERSQSLIFSVFTCLKTNCSYLLILMWKTNCSTAPELCFLPPPKKTTRTEEKWLNASDTIFRSNFWWHFNKLSFLCGYAAHGGSVVFLPKLTFAYQGKSARQNNEGNQQDSCFDNVSDGWRIVMHKAILWATDCCAGENAGVVGRRNWMNVAETLTYKQCGAMTMK